jgi:hypothetical protein
MSLFCGGVRRAEAVAIAIAIAITKILLRFAFVVAGRSL